MNRPGRHTPRVDIPYHETLVAPDFPLDAAARAEVVRTVDRAIPPGYALVAGCGAAVAIVLVRIPDGMPAEEFALRQAMATCPVTLPVRGVRVAETRVTAMCGPCDETYRVFLASHADDGAQLPACRGAPRVFTSRQWSFGAQALRGPVVIANTRPAFRATAVSMNALAERIATQRAACIAAADKLMPLSRPAAPRTDGIIDLSGEEPQSPPVLPSQTRASRIDLSGEEPQSPPVLPSQTRAALAGMPDKGAGSSRALPLQARAALAGMSDEELEAFPMAQPRARPLRLASPGEGLEAPDAVPVASPPDSPLASPTRASSGLIRGNGMVIKRLAGNAVAFRRVASRDGAHTIEGRRRRRFVASRGRIIARPPVPVRATFEDVVARAGPVEPGTLLDDVVTILKTLDALSRSTPIAQNRRLCEIWAWRVEFALGAAASAVIAVDKGYPRAICHALTSAAASASWAGHMLSIGATSSFPAFMARVDTRRPEGRPKRRKSRRRLLHGARRASVVVVE